MAKRVYLFSEGNKDERELLGGKGANLADMSSLGLPVPAGFTITTEVCDLYYQLGRKYPEGMDQQIDDNIKKLEDVSGKTFGHGSNPLLVSVRSGAAVSMPGMMDTVLNLGLNDETLPALIKLTGNERFGWEGLPLDPLNDVRRTFVLPDREPDWRVRRRRRTTPHTSSRTARRQAG